MRRWMDRCESFKGHTERQIGQNPFSESPNYQNYQNFNIDFVIVSSSKMSQHLIIISMQIYDQNDKTVLFYNKIFTNK